MYVWKIRTLLIALILTLLFWGSFFAKTASSQLIESRLNNVEADLNRLESRLSLIESQINRSNSPAPSKTTPSPSSPSRTQRSQQQRDQMFDRLATLVIELKQQVNTLEQRILKLEKC
ncbi:hypothetical protein NIES4101_87520 [Calothrix sp. NIES-4101]|nr:hypothetical protein NIES4101_87520 [Calothrix sp. NIES-4101]